MQKLFTTLAFFLALVIYTSGVDAQAKAKKPAETTKTSSASNNKPVGKKAKGKVSKKTADTKTAKKKNKSSKKQKKKSKRQLKAEADQAAAEAEKTFTDARKKLDSKDPNQVREAVKVLGMSGNTAAVEPLMNLLKTGPRSDITDAIIFGLGALGDEDAAPLLMTYLNHRRPDARIAALFALEKFHSKEVTHAIEAALRDSDRQVRASAALALGKRGSVGSVPILFRAFERGVTDASIAIGQLGSEEDSKRMLSYLGRQDIKVLLAGLEEFLHRPDFPESGKLYILNRLFDLAGPEVWRFAVAYKASFPPDTKEEEDKVYKLVCRMVRQIKDKQ